LSDDWLRVIPTDPTFVPQPVAAERARQLLTQLAPADPSGTPAIEVSVGEVAFIDAGENFDSLSCPWCGAVIDIDWWQGRMGAAASSGFADLLCRTPCCDVTTSLNDLLYDWPQGFARWWLEVMNPTVLALSSSELEAIADALGHPVRVVNVRY